MKPVFFLLFAIVLLFCHCSTSGVSTNVPDGTKLYRILNEGKLVHDFEYNFNGKIAKQSMYGFQNNKTMEVTYFYDSDDKLIKTESYSDVSASISTQLLVYSYTDYKYDAGGRLIEETTYTKKDNVFEFSSKTSLTYDTKERVVSRLQLSIDNKPYGLSRYEYDLKENVIIQESYQFDGTTPKLGSRSVYEHDNKKNPYINLSVMPFSVNKNNITKITFTNHNTLTGTPATTSTETLYKSYNGAGFPVEVIEYGTNRFIYQYK